MGFFRLIIVCLFLPCGVWAADKLKTLQEKADGGDAQAAYDLAEALYWADGVERDLEQSANYALAASLKGNPLAQYRHAVQLLLGQGIGQDVKSGFVLLHKAIPELQKLAEKKNTDALYKMGKLYQLGLINSNHFNPDYSKALANFRLAAARGHVRAAYLAGQMMRLGLGTPKDNVKALELYKRSADAGFADAASHVWLLHSLAGKQLVSEKDAARYLKQAAEMGLINAQALYGNALAEGKLGLKADKQSALEWFQKAAKQGNARSQFLLGIMCAVGSEETGVKKDIKEAFVWLALAERTEDKRAQGDARNHLNKVRNEIDPLDQLALLKRVNEYRLVETTVTENTALGLEGAPNSIQNSLRLDNLVQVADSGNEEAMYSLGLFYSDQGEFQKAEQRLKESANKGFVDAMVSLADGYVSGGFGEPDINEGGQWYKKAADKGNVFAMTRLGKLAFSGKLPEVKPDKAADWWRKAAEKGFAPAQANLGELYWQGDGGVKQNFKLGIEWMHKAADQSYARAEASLATMYAQSFLENTPDLSKAAEWARRGAMQGDALAQRTLGLLYYEGKGVVPSKLPNKIDHKRQAFKWLKLAEKGGVPGLGPVLNDLQKEMEPSDIRRALNEAGQFVAFGRYDPEKKNAGVQKSDNLEELIREANQGKGAAYLELARRFDQGRGVKPDSIESYKWYTLAFNHGLEVAFLERSEMKKSHDMMLDDIVEAKKRVREFKPKP